MLASGVALTFTLLPSLSPDPGTVLAASLSVQAVDPPVTLGNYLTHYHPAGIRPGTDPLTLKVPGYIVYLHLATKGNKHRNVRLDTVLYDWSTKAPVSEPTAPEGFRPDTPNDEWIDPVFVFAPLDKDFLPSRRAFFVRLRLFAGNVLLAFADTRRIAPAPLPPA